uniref:C-type lectin domain-containing protein n=1 Tax=Sinocyclocheilus anshuiensis TaxID=1608454 RepID=A0A671P9P0_9TELE
MVTFYSSVILKGKTLQVNRIKKILKRLLFVLHVLIACCCFFHVQMGHYPTKCTNLLTFQEHSSEDRLKPGSKLLFSFVVILENMDVNLQLTKMIQDYTCAWIGLFRDSWTWSDQTNTSSSLRWALGQPDNSFGRDSCAALDYDGQIADESCSRLYYFLCQTSMVLFKSFYFLLLLYCLVSRIFNLNRIFTLHI